MNQYRYLRICKRCGMCNYYVHESQVKLTEHDTKCNYCKGIPDNVLNFFINHRLYFRKCPQCNRLLRCRNKRGLLARTRENLPCKSCTSHRTGQHVRNKRRLEWKHVVGTIHVTSKKLARIIKFWSAMTPDQQSAHLNKTDVQKTYYWSHLSRMNKRLRLVRLKKALSKYRGKNHWMKRPEVYAKVKRSCRKYRGAGHWFRRDRT